MSTTIQVLHAPNLNSANQRLQRVYYRFLGRELANIEPKTLYAADMVLDREIKNPGPFVELLLIEHLVVKKNLFSNNLIGPSVNFITGSSLLGALASGGQDKSCHHPQMIQHRHMFASRFFDSSYAVDNSTDWIEDGFVDQQEISVEKVYANFCNGSYIDNPFVGKLVMTHHALSRYQERRGYTSMSRAWKKIVPLLETCKWTLDRSFVMDQKTHKISETWRVKALRQKPFFVVTTRQGRCPSHKRIVTIMEKEPDLKKAHTDTCNFNPCEAVNNARF